MKTQEHSKRKHSEFSPSSAKRWMTCPGSVRLSRTAPAQFESRYAREGTEAHECLEFIVKRYADKPNAAVQALNKWPREMVDHAVNSADRLFSSDLRPSKEAKLLVESRVVIKSITHRIYGTLDYAWVDRWGTLVIADYKYGAGETVMPIGDDGKPNPQLMIYALGIAEKHDYDFERVKLAIIQPRVWKEGDDPVSHADVSIKQLRGFRLEVKEAVLAANRPDAPLIAGSHCRWCPAAATCPENGRSALQAANLVFDVDDGLQAAPNVPTLTTTDIAKYLDAAPRLEAWIEAMRAHAYKLAEDGEKIPGYKLVPKRATRVWLPEAEQAALKLFGTKAYIPAAPKFLSPAQLEKELGANAKTFTAKYTSAVSTGFNLVPESDKRAGVVSTSVFDHE